jgi:hypothetical protein
MVSLSVSPMQVLELVCGWHRACGRFNVILTDMRLSAHLGGQCNELKQCRKLCIRSVDSAQIYAGLRVVIEVSCAGPWFAALMRPGQVGHIDWSVPYESKCFLEGTTNDSKHLRLRFCKIESKAS